MLLGILSFLAGLVVGIVATAYVISATVSSVLLGRR